MPLVQLEVTPAGIATLILKDPDRRNAMGLEMAALFKAQVDRIRADVGMRALIITGAGTAFSAGGDLQMLIAKPTKSFQQNRLEMLDYYHSFLGIAELSIPTIAAVNGHAMGAGLGLALACDVRVLSESAKLGLNFTRLGLHPGMGTTFFLPRLVGHAKALDLLTSGRTLTAGDALQWGLVSQIVPATDILETAQSLASAYLQCGPIALAGLLKTLRPTASDLQQALVRESEEQSKNYASAEFAEGLAAALAKRPPCFPRHGGTKTHTSMGQRG